MIFLCVYNSAMTICLFGESMTLYVNSAQAVKHYHSVPTSPFNSIDTINTSVSFNKFYNSEYNV